MNPSVRRATAGELHAIAMPEGDDSAAELWVMEPTVPAVVMGSSQSADAFAVERLAADGVELAVRRSGGGAVFIAPGSVVWVDLLVPKSSRWPDGLVETFMIAGRLWRDALVACGFDGLDLVEQGPGGAPESRAACWAGRGWGEVVAGPTKIVGLSQRRTRWGARVQTMAVLDTSPRRVCDYLVATSELDLDRVAARIGPGLEPSLGINIDRNALIKAVVTQFEAAVR